MHIIVWCIINNGMQQNNNNKNSNNKYETRMKYNNTAEHEEYDEESNV